LYFCLSMNKAFHIFLSFSFLCCADTVYAQTGILDTSQNDSANSNVVIHADARLATLVAKKGKGSPVGTITSGKGFRVQIYNGNDRKAAINTKIDFMRRYPNIHTYMTYIAPQFRVKVGDFRTHPEAQKLNHELIQFYNPTMIVPDIIVINSIQDD
jgi:hypothetical protein